MGLVSLKLNQVSAQHCQGYVCFSQKNAFLFMLIQNHFWFRQVPIASRRYLLHFANTKSHFANTEGRTPCFPPQHLGEVTGCRLGRGTKHNAEEEERDVAIAGLSTRGRASIARSQAEPRNEGKAQLLQDCQLEAEPR